MKFLITIFALTFSLTSFAKPLAAVVERNAHDIMKLVKTNALPAVAAEKLHMVQVKETATGYDLLAVLDHEGNHDVTPAHIKFAYDKNLKIVKYEYVDGFVTSKATPFVKASTAKLFDLGPEVFMDSEDPALVAFAEKTSTYHLEFDAEKNAAVFEILSTDGKHATLWLTLEGDLIDVKFE